MGKQIEKIREVYNNGSGDRRKAIDSLKKRLPAVTFSGRFKQRRSDSLIEHSGLLCLDMDSLGDQLPAVREQLLKSPHVLFLFVSPSGDGLKILFRISADPARHQDSFRAIFAHVLELTGQRIDESGKDIARLCFVSFDPDLYFNAKAILIEPLPPEEKPIRNSATSADLGIRQRVAVDLLGNIEWDSESQGFLPCPGKHLHTTDDDERDCEIHLDGAPNLHCFHNHCRGILDGLNHELQSRIGKAESDRAQAHDIRSEQNSSGQSASPVSRDDFYAYMPMHNYIFVPARDIWPAASVNARIPPVPLKRHGKPILDEAGKQKFIAASAWLDENQPVEQMTWAPGFPMLIKDRLISDGGWIHRDGCSTFNLYRPPTIKLGDATKAGRWLDHIAKLYPNDKDHIIRWLACRVQRPNMKINHALFLGGAQGIGKDTLLYPVKHAVGQWNVAEILPPTLLGRFNGRYALYERLKAYTAAPPDVIRVDEKYLREYSVLNVTGVVLTSNFKTSGLYLPADDRRHYVAWSDLEKDAFDEQYWSKIYAWYNSAGCRHVAAYLAQLDISDFNPKSPPPKTDSFWEIVDTNRAPQTSELADALEYLGSPAVVTIPDVIETAFNANVITPDFREWLEDGRNARQIPHRFEECGYIAVRNPAHKDQGRWRIGKKRLVIYTKKDLSKREQLAAARAKAEEGRE
jgi:hypothetical protein